MHQQHKSVNDYIFDLVKSCIFGYNLSVLCCDKIYSNRKHSQHHFNKRKLQNAKSEIYAIRRWMCYFILAQRANSSWSWRLCDNICTWCVLHQTSSQFVYWPHSLRHSVLFLQRFLKLEAHNMRMYKHNKPKSIYIYVFNMRCVAIASLIF